MDVRHEIAARLEQLSPELQERVLRFVETLTVFTVKGEPGVALLPFAGTLDSFSADEMRAAIEEGCETVDELDW